MLSFSTLTVIYVFDNNFFCVLKEMLYFYRLLHKSSRENRENYFSGEDIRVDFRKLRILPNDFVLTTSFSTTAARCIL